MLFGQFLLPFPSTSMSRTPGDIPVRQSSVVSMEKAEVSESYCKKAPRIISRDEKESVKNDSEMDDEVGEGFVVRGGVMMRIADLNKEQWKPMKRFYIDVNRSQIYHNVRDDVSLGNDSASSRVTVEVSALPGDGGMFHLCDNLPGVANEVESYPCRYCPNRIFLTSFGLERHTEMEHKAHLPEVMEEISRIHNEWRRREAFRAIAKKRREALKKTRMLTEVVRRSQGLRSESSAARHYAKGFDCHICGVRFEANWELMMNHFRAHRRNNDLRRRLLADFGPEYVARCTCHHCHLVFVNEKNLVLHKELSHVRKRKYVCKWCGDVCLSMNELNEHKKDVHRISYSRPDKSSVFNTVKLSHKNADGNTMQKKTSKSGVADTSTRNRTSFLIQNPCIAKCSECGLTTVKPSLLIRHMQRVHNKNCFSAMIEMRGLPDIRVDMDRGKVTWWCCNYSFEDRHRFIHHRKSCHRPFLEHGHLQNQPVDNKSEIITKQGTDNRGVMNAGQIVQLVSHDGTQDDELYVLMGEEGDIEENIGIVMGEARTRESVMESSQQITLTAKEFMHLRQQVAESFDGGMQLFLVDDVDDPQESSPSPGMEPAVDFIANNMVDNDALNSLLVPGTQIPAADDKYYSDARSTDSEFSVVNVPDPTEDEMSQNNLPLPSENLVSLETTSAGLPIPTITFNGSSVIDNPLNHHFQIQRNDLNEITAVPAITTSNIARQIYDDTACSSTTLCPKMDGIAKLIPKTFPSLIVISNKITATSPSNIDCCTVGGSKTNGFLERSSNRSTSVLDSIPTLLDLNQKNTLATSTATKLVEISSLQHLSSTIVNENTVSPYISQDGNTNLHKTTIYNP
uniref:C2H2-type domain-containing protein n=1 Tax=Setaria digitata TaxID=48799 RepID=A0A915Q1A7_9BILA